VRSFDNRQVLRDLRDGVSSNKQVASETINRRGCEVEGKESSVSQELRRHHVCVVQLVFAGFSVGSPQSTIAFYIVKYNAIHEVRLLTTRDRQSEDRTYRDAAFRNCSRGVNLISRA
jgi:hypothetical protein